MRLNYIIFFHFSQLLSLAMAHVLAFSGFEVLAKPFFLNIDDNIERKTNQVLKEQKT